MRRSLVLALSLSALAAAGSARAEERGNAETALRGFRYVLKPAVAYDAATPRAALATSTSGQDVTFALSDHIGWALPIGPLVISPGASLPIWFFANNVTLGVLADAEVHLPLRWISPYLVVGGGGAFFFGGGDTARGIPNQQGGVFRAGAGLTVFPTTWLGLGAQGAYARVGPLDIVEISWPIELRF